MSYQARRITIVILLLLTVALAGVSIYIGIRTAQDQSSQDSNAGTCTWICNSCGCGCDDDAKLLGPQCNPVNTTTDCEVNASATCLTISSPSGGTCNFTVERYTRPMEGPNDECFTSENRQASTQSNGSYCTDNVPLCTCMQIDILTNGQTVGDNWNGVGIKAGNWVPACEQGRTCGQTCVGSGQGTCASGNSCVSGTCVANACANDPSKCEANKCTLIEEEPEKSYSCTDGFTCIELDDATGEYSDLASCTRECIPPGQPVCGDSCTSRSQCPNDHSCQLGKCVLNGCTDSTCQNGCTPICGGPCGDGLSCPTGHTCDASTNKCIINACVGNSDCVNNGCYLPQTAIYGDERDYVIYGLMFMLIGIIIYRYNGIEFALNLPTELTAGLKSWNQNRNQKSIHRAESKRKKLKDKERSKFEKRIIDK